MSEKLSLEEDIKVTSNSPDDSRLKKSWGHITALPSEYLIHFCKGKLNEKTSKQGGSCFKWIGDTVFIIPTSLKEIIFQANQLTKDNVDVKIRGMVVYRISNPLQIYKLINFSNRQRAEEKLARMIGDMCRSTAKWLVANMQVEECIRKRKEEIAEALRKETSVIVNDEQTGWGVEIVTIDIQDVFIQDEEIFTAMQSLFKSKKINESKLAQMEMERNVEVNQLEQESEIAEHRKTTEIHKGKLQAEVENEKLEIENTIQIKKLEKQTQLSEYQKQAQLNEAKQKAEIEQEKVKLQQQNEIEKFNLEKYQVEQNEALENYKFEQQMLRQEKENQEELTKAKQEVELLKQRIEAENSISKTNLEKHFIEYALPVIAETMAQHMKDVKIQMYQQEGQSPFSFLLNDIVNIVKNRVNNLENSEDK